MMLKTGNKGFTLIEVMVTTLVLSVGIVALFESFFICMDTFDYYDHYVHLACWLDAQLWVAQNELSRFGPQAKVATHGDFVVRGKVYPWNLYYYQMQDAGALYWVTIDIAWQKGKKTLHLSRDAYALYEKRE